ncbi:MAG: OmpA family protein [Verrucomicrobiota bacterium]
MGNATRTTLVVLTIIVLILAGFYFFYDSYQKKSALADKTQQIEKLEAQVNALTSSLDDLTIQNQELDELLSGEKDRAEEAARQTEILKARGARLQKAVSDTQSRLSKERSLYQEQRKKLLDEMQKSKSAKSTLEDKLKEAIASKDVIISNLKGKLTVNVASKILFKSGSSDLIPEGKQVLDKLALALEDEDDQIVQIEGHTDNVPISSTRFPSNWDLSASRAIAAVRYLNDVCSIPADRLSAVAYGQHRPIAPNDTKENRAKNRRIEIILSPGVEKVIAE